MRKPARDIYAKTGSVPSAQSPQHIEGEITITGDLISGETLSVVTDTLSDDDGLGALSFQWYADNQLISGATAQTLMLSDSEVGTSISVKVSYLDAHGTSETITAAGSTLVLPTNTSLDHKNKPGDEVINGTDGIDRVIYTYGYSDVDILVKNGKIYITSADGTDEISKVERIEFSDVSLAFDLDAQGNASKAAKILGAVFGKEAVKNAEYAGIGLALLDSAEHTYESLTGFALNAAGARSSKDVVNILYTNLVGRAPEQNVASQYVELLDTAAYSWGELGVYSANLQLNTDNIDLVGLAATGLEFLPFGV